ncbi:MAG: hypothetical protein MUE84_09935 [Hyphomonas sp.]|nr:hypothetical protein [Hyphomonas sp.]
MSIFTRIAAIISLVLSLGFITAPAQADSLTFKMRSYHKFSVDVKFFSQNRNNVWPGVNSHWTIKDYEVKNYRLSCVRGERICFGAATSGSGRLKWGVSLTGKAGCKGCCYTCNGDTSTNIINLNER